MERSDENKQRFLQCPVLGTRVVAGVILLLPGSQQRRSRATRARRGQPQRAQLRLRGVLPLCVGAGVMAAAVASRGRALLWAGAALLRQGGVGEALRARVEGSTPGRYFSLSHYRVSAGWALGSLHRGPGGLFVPSGEREGPRRRGRGAAFLGTRWLAGWLGVLCGHSLTPASLAGRTRSSWSAGGRCR